MSIVYIAHALGRDPVERPQNILRVQRWFRWLIDYGPESWSFQIPWLVYAQNLDEETYRPRGIRDGQRFLRSGLYDIIVLVGGERTQRSFGSQAERDIMIEMRKGVCDLTFLGEEPPRGSSLPYDGEGIVVDGRRYPHQRSSMTRLILEQLRVGFYSNAAPATSTSR